MRVTAAFAGLFALALALALAPACGRAPDRAREAPPEPEPPPPDAQGGPAWELQPPSPAEPQPQPEPQPAPDGEGEREGEGQPGSVTIATLNLRCLLDDWDRRLPAVVALLEQADLLLLQEVCDDPVDDRRQLDELLEALAWPAAGRAAARTHLSWDRYDEGLAIVSRYGLADPHDADLPGGALPRKVLLTRVDVPALGPLVVATTHLDHRSADDRLAQAAAVAAAVNDYAAPNEAVVLGGDLNEAPAGGVDTALAEAGLHDVRPPGPGGETFPSEVPRARIDRILLRPGAAELLTVRAWTPAWPHTLGSDHLAVMATLGRRNGTGD